MYIADTDEEAIERARSAYRAYGTHFAKPLPEGVARNEPHRPPEQIGRAPGEPPFERYLGGEGVIAGSPRTVREYAERWAEASGCNYWVGSFQWGDLTHAEASRSLALFADEVMPALG
jgi:alkanesulfonate monooxygenase SsuD/methylene tetrahydromethanopterin reductase-like flavin-dependent oxidoreductase (luciferase family)